MPVTVKLDEHLPRSLVARLAEHGIDADTVLDESLGGRSDPDVLAAATAEGRMVFTLDRGFGDIRAYPPGTHPGIVVLRTDDQSAAAVTSAFVAVVRAHDMNDLRGTITVVHRGLLRIRR